MPHCMVVTVLLAGLAGTLLDAQTPSTSETVTNRVASTGITNRTDSVSNETHVITVGDKLSYRVLEDRESPKILTVAAGGEIEIPYLGRVVVAGKSVSQAQNELKGLLEKDLYYAATVVLALEELAAKSFVAGSTKSRQVVVAGQVRVQGVQEIPYGEKYMVSRAILKAGGFSAFANGGKVQIVRKNEKNKTEKIVVDVLAILKEGKIENDVELMPDDTVIVPEKFINF